MLLTLDRILGQAVAAGFGDVATLRYRFLHLQRIGLIGHAVGKTNKRGGAGLWHPIQGQLFLQYLRQMPHTHRATLANEPVGLWLLEEPGVELEQAQRSLRFWASKTLGDSRAADRRSLRRRGVLALVDQVATSRVGRPTRRRLRDIVERALDALPDVSEASMRELREALRAAAAPEVAERAYLALRLRFVAVGHLDLLSSPDPLVVQTWEWCRQIVALTGPNYIERNELLGSGCGTALQLWGMAIAGQSGRWIDKGIGRPPKLELAR